MLKKTGAFTLIEVVLAITILVASVYALTNLQIRSLFRVLSDREEIERIFLVKKSLYDVYLHPEKTNKRQVVKIEEPEVTVVTQVPEVIKKSAFGKVLDSMHLVEAEGLWKSGVDQRRVKMLTLVRKPRDEKK